MKPDISVVDPNGKTVLIVEVKRKSGTSPKWAAEVRKNVLSRYSSKAYFLLATPDKFYFWRKEAPQSRPTEPDFTLDAKEFLEQYSPAGKVAPDALSGFALQFAVGDWLRSLTYGGADSSTYLSNSGLLSALHGGRVVLEPEA
jgi:hypothetical protein